MMLRLLYFTPPVPALIAKERLKGLVAAVAIGYETHLLGGSLQKRLSRHFLLIKAWTVDWCAATPKTGTRNPLIEPRREAVGRASDYD